MAFAVPAAWVGGAALVGGIAASVGDIGIGDKMGGIANPIGGLLGGGTGSQKQETTSTQKSTPVIIPRQPPVIPNITTGGGSEISVTPEFSVGNLGGIAPADRDASAGAVNAAEVQALTGADINVSLAPVIQANRAQFQQGLENLKGQAQNTVTDIQGQIEAIRNIPLPELETARFDQIAELGEQTRGQLLNINQGLGTQISALDQAFKQLGENTNAFAEARTRGLMESREKARRDASRRGISGPLAALATNPIDTQIADERSKAVQDVQEAQLQIREQQRLLQQTRLQVQQQFEQVRQGELAVVSEKFSQADQRFQSGLDRETTAASAQELVQGSQAMIQSILSDQSGLNQQALEQELAELGFGAQIYQMLIDSQLVTPTAQTTSQTSRSRGGTQGDVLGDVASIAGAVGSIWGAFGGGA